MTTQNNTKFRIVMPKLMHNISILYQNGDITTDEKHQLCQATKKALASNDFNDLRERFRTLRYGTLFPDVVDECIQITSN